MAETVDGSVIVAHVLSSPSNLTRLALCERDLTQAAVDGVWWPKSLDLSLELPDLVTVFNLWVGRVHRVVYDPSAWLPAPPRVIRRNEMVSLDPYRLVFSDTIYLKGTRSRDAVLFVLSPSRPEDDARRLLREVAASVQPMNAGVLRELVCQCDRGASRTLETSPGGDSSWPPASRANGPSNAASGDWAYTQETGTTQAPSKGRDV